MSPSSSLFDLSSSKSTVTVGTDVSLGLDNHKNSPHSLRCHSLNMRGIVNKQMQLRAVLETENLDVLAVTEAFLGEDILDSETTDSTHGVFRKD